MHKNSFKKIKVYRAASLYLALLSVLFLILSVTEGKVLNLLGAGILAVVGLGGWVYYNRMIQKGVTQNGKK